MHTHPFTCRLCNGPTDDDSWRVVYHRLSGTGAHVAIFCQQCLGIMLHETQKAAASAGRSAGLNALRGGLGSAAGEPAPRLDQVVHVLEPDLRSDADMPPLHAADVQADLADLGLIL